MHPFSPTEVTAQRELVASPAFRANARGSLSQGSIRTGPRGLVLISSLLALTACTTPSVRRYIPSAEVVSQKALGSMACGPCALYNSLLRGSEEHRRVVESLPGADHVERVQAMIVSYGQDPSVDYPEPRLRYDKVGGTTPRDLELFAGDLASDYGLSRVRGQRLDRRKGESREEQLRRIHALLQSSDLPPVVSVRSFIASQKEGQRTLWHGGAGHFLTVAKVGPIPSRSSSTGPATGFLMECADSANGRLIPVFVSLEQTRKYTATLGFKVGPDGKEDWEWAPDSPYLVVTVPDLNLETGNAKWFERSVMVLRWALTQP